MVLQLDNFVIKAIFLDINNNISELILNNSVEGFTNSNSASILGVEKTKYKIMLNNISIPENTKYVTFQISLLKDSKYYNPYLFLPIRNENNSNTFDGPGRALTFKLHNNIFNYIWFYFTLDSIEKIINEFEPLDEIIDSNKYIKEYTMNNMVMTM